MGQSTLSAAFPVYSASFIANHNSKIFMFITDVASGGASDWALGAANVDYSYSMELRDTGRYGFLLPPRFIEPVGVETWQFHKTVAEAVIQKYGDK